MKSVHQIASMFFVVGLIYALSTVWISKSIIESVPELKDTVSEFDA